MRTVSRLEKECKAKGRELAHAESAQGDSAPKRLNGKTKNENFVPYVGGGGNHRGETKSQN